VIYVIGGSSVDLYGLPQQNLRMRDSNPGAIKIGYGGVGRNIAENLVRLKQDVWFVSVFGKDANGIKMREHCANIGMHLDDCLSAEQSDSYLAILDENRDMAVAVADVAQLFTLDDKALAPVCKRVQAKDLVVLDANLNQSQVDYLLMHLPPVTIAADPISILKCARFAPWLNKLGVFKPNRVESEALCGFVLDSQDALKRGLCWFLRQGVKEILISLGEDGLIAARKNEAWHLYHDPVEIVNASGAGDALMSGYLAAKCEGLPFDKCLEIGAGCAILTLRSNDTCPFELDIQKACQCSSQYHVKKERIEL
jgi:pseudouridine kinase